MISLEVPSGSLIVPTGWEKGEPLVVTKRLVHQRMSWFVEQRPSFRYDRDVPCDAIASMWFYSWDEFSEFIQWWNKDK